MSFRPRFIPALSCVLLLWLVLAGQALALNDYPRNELWVTNGTVFAVERSADRIYLGGNFTSVAPFTGAALLLDVATGERDPRLAKIKGTWLNTVVHAAVSDGSGGWYLGGRFEWADDTPAQGLVRILPNGKLDPDFSFSFGGERVVRALALAASGVLYVGGEFNAINGEPRSGVAAIDTGSNTLTAWAPNVPFGPVSAILLSGNTVFLGAGSGLHAADAATAALQPIDTSAGVEAMALSSAGTTLYFGGGALRAFNLATQQLVGTWNPAPNGEVKALTVSGSTVYVGGAFTAIGGQARAYLAAVNANTGTASNWDPAADGPVADLILRTSTLIVGGAFGSIGGQPRRGLAEVDIFDASVRAIDPRLHSPRQFTGFLNVEALALVDGRLMVGGWFSGSGAVDRRHIAALDAHTGAVTDWAPEADNMVQNLLLDGDTLYAHGLFLTIGGQARSRLAALDVTLNSNNATAFVADVEGLPNDMGRSGSLLYFAGSFSSVNGQARANVAAVDATTGSLSPWNPGTDRLVNALQVVDDVVYIGGTFTQVGNQFRNRLAAVQASTGAILPFDPNVSGGMPLIRDLLVSDGKIWVTGTFQNIGGLNRQRFAELDAVTGQATSLDIGLTSASPPTLAKRGNILYLTASGGLGSIQGVPMPGAGAIDLSTGLPTGWRPVPSATGTEVAVLGDHVMLFGTGAASNAPRLTPNFFQEYGLAPDENGIVVDFSPAYASLAASLPPALADGDIDDNGRLDADEFACFATLLSQGNASVVPEIASTFLLNRSQMALDLGNAVLAQAPGTDALLAGWLMFGNAGWVGDYASTCPNCLGSYAANTYHYTVNPDIALAFALCPIGVAEPIFGSGFE